MYTIYEADSGQLSMFEPTGEEPLELNEAEEMLRRLQRDDPAEFARVASLRNGIRSALAAVTKGAYVMCRAGEYQQLFLMDPEGNVCSRDLPRVLAAIRCERTARPAERPEGFNAAVMRVSRLFAEEVKQRTAERQYSVTLTPAQRYVQREIRVLFGATEDEEARARLNLLERAFCGTLSPVLRRELNKLRRNGVAGQNLERELRGLYEFHGLGRKERRGAFEQAAPPLPQVICSEALT